jgi:hypothetical protein
MTKRKVQEEFYKSFNLIRNPKTDYTTGKIMFAQAVTWDQKVPGLISAAHGLL